LRTWSLEKRCTSLPAAKDRRATFTSRSISLEQCIKDNSTSAVKELTVASWDKSYAVAELNFVDNVGRSFEYCQYLVARNGIIELLGEKSRGQCGFAI
jgi:hypothetical protein